MDQTLKKRIVVAMTGASGSILALDLLRQLRLIQDLEIHFVLSRGAEVTMGYEAPSHQQELRDYAHQIYDNSSIGAAIASGSFNTVGMVVVPCSMKTVAGIHSGYSESLILRAADVTLKERRPLVLIPREAPFSPIHLRNLYELSMMGVTILPPVMTFYHKPKEIEDMVTQLTGKILDCFGLPSLHYKRWNG